ncbi:hypothetical protein H0H87_007910 [Tephrocybe sp. NHM501043]|nr:hypothetical protein H0H87_007910 [Tephrocybe sp. NHM501043]
MSSRSYKDAVEHLNSLQTNAAALEAARASGSSRLSEFAIPEMLEYLGRIGYSPHDLNALNVIHITGTKGKGSTSAFTDSILRHALPSARIGLYTSPHLVAVRERIRINGTPISEEQFATYFFQIWDRLVANDVRQFPSTSLMPGYFRFVTLLAFHVFLSLKVDATVLEVGVGGTYDSTNIVPKPVVTGITALGIDHVTVLGKTLEEIAWQKGGIFKVCVRTTSMISSLTSNPQEGVPAITVNQPVEALRVLEERAHALKASSYGVIPVEPTLSNIELGTELSDTFVTALKEARWPGRCQTVKDPKRQNVTWYLDGAHTVESLECCMQWFASPKVGLGQGESKPVRVLIFNCTSGRSGSSFLGTLHSGITAQLSLHKSDETPNQFFDYVIFCTNVTYADGHFKGDLTTVAIAEDDLTQLKTQHELATAWSSLVSDFPASRIHVLPSIEHAVNEIEKLQGPAGVKVLVAGSLHLVGGAIEASGLSNVAL